MTPEASHVNGFGVYLWVFMESRSDVNSVSRGVSAAMDTLSLVLKAVVMLLCGQASVNGDDFCVTWSSIQISFHSSVYDITATY